MKTISADGINGIIFGSISALIVLTSLGKKHDIGQETHLLAQRIAADVAPLCYTTRLNPTVDPLIETE
jgi:hypothetical protein